MRDVKNTKSVKTKKKKIALPKHLLIRVCIFAFVIYAAVTLVEMQVEIASKRQTLDNMRKTVEAQKIANNEIARQLEGATDEETIERIARDKLDFVYPEEKIFIDISGS